MRAACLLVAWSFMVGAVALGAAFAPCCLCFIAGVLSVLPLLEEPKK